MKLKIITKFAVLFKHSRGWTYLYMCDSAPKAQVYIRDQKAKTPLNASYKWKIVPCKVHLNLTDAVAEKFL